MSLICAYKKDVKTQQIGLNSQGSRPLSEWSKNNNAHLATWMVEMTITDLGLSFDEARRLTMGEINEKISGPRSGSDSTDAATDQHLITFSKLVRIYKPTWYRISYEEGQATIRTAMGLASNTLIDLAAAVDKVMLFEGDILTRHG
ncbi:MAG: hypothetical protein ACI8Z1_001355 [Candidatus Azotimanducaceae bacterium]|jgi:hypothetical protein